MKSSQKEIQIEALHPKRLAAEVKKSRERIGWSETTLAKNAFVQFASVTRVEDSDEETGILTALNIAETAKALDFEGYQPDPDVIALVQSLGHDNQRASEMYATLANMCFGQKGGVEIEINALGCYLREKPRFRMLVREEKWAHELVRHYENDFKALILPKDLGVLCRECLKRIKKKDLGDRVIWNHLAAGRSLNVSSRRIVESVTALAPLVDEAGLMGTDLFKNFAVSAFVNHLRIDREHQAQLRKHGLKPIKHFWQIIHDAIAMRRIIVFDQICGKV